MRFLVTGATGWIGALVVAELCRRGHELVCLVREDRRQERLRRLERIAPSRLSILHGDVTQPRAGVSEEALNRLRGKVERSPLAMARARSRSSRKPSVRLESRRSVTRPSANPSAARSNEAPTLIGASIDREHEKIQVLPEFGDDA